MVQQLAAIGECLQQLRQQTGLPAGEGQVREIQVGQHGVRRLERAPEDGAVRLPRADGEAAEVEVAAEAGVVPHRRLGRAAMAAGVREDGEVQARDVLLMDGMCNRHRIFL